MPIVVHGVQNSSGELGDAGHIYVGGGVCKVSHADTDISCWLCPVFWCMVYGPSALDAIGVLLLVVHGGL